MFDFDDEYHHNVNLLIDVDDLSQQHSDDNYKDLKEPGDIDGVNDHDNNDDDGDLKEPGDC